MSDEITRSNDDETERLNDAQTESEAEELKTNDAEAAEPATVHVSEAPIGTIKW